MQVLYPIEARSWATQVLVRLKTAILSGELRPGEPVRNADIARQLSVSSVPVREGILQLEQLGLVVRTPNCGTSVVQLTRDEMIHFMEVREHLEEKAFVEAASRLTEENFKELTHRVEALDEHSRNGRSFESARDDFEFHQFVWQRCGNPVLCNTLERLASPVYAYISLVRVREADGDNCEGQRHRHF